TPSDRPSPPSPGPLRLTLDQTMVRPTLQALFTAAAVAAAAGTPASGRDIAAWPFDGSSLLAGVAGHAATVSGDPAAVIWVSGKDAKSRGAVRLNAKSGAKAALLSVPDPAALTGHADGGSGLTSLTIEVDLKLDRLNGQAQIVRKTDGDV